MANEIIKGTRVEYTTFASGMREVWGGIPHGPGSSSLTGIALDLPFWWDTQLVVLVQWSDGQRTMSVVDQLKRCGDEG